METYLQRFIGIEHTVQGFIIIIELLVHKGITLYDSFVPHCGYETDILQNDIFLSAIKYEEHKIQVAASLLGMQLRYTKHLCFR